MFLEELTNLIGIAGYEHKIRKHIKGIVEKYVDKVETDALGNLICIKKGTKKGKKILLAAHMDEVGFIITKITKDGFLKFTNSGGIDPRVLPAKKVLIGDKEIPGVICWAPPHLKKKSSTIPSVSSLVIDIGESSDKDIDIKVGDYASFNTKFSFLNKNIIKGKAFDDRIGCALIMDILKNNKQYNYDLVAVFTVQEEIGLRGASVIAERVNPSYALILEGTGAADLPLEEDNDLSSIPKLGNGPVLTITDGRTIVDKKLLNFIVDVAKKNKIKFQFKQPNIGGTDAGKIHISKTGIPSAVISIASRYIHSPVSLAHIKDYKDTLKLVTKTLNNFESSNLQGR